MDAVMSARIEGGGYAAGLAPQAAAPRNAGSAASNAAAGTSAPAVQDSLQLSGRGQELAQAQLAVSRAPDTSAARVASVRTAIANGTYRPDLKRTADKLLERESSGR
jgi:negative regulator of flagellin synthesis FlgM